MKSKLIKKKKNILSTVAIGAIVGLSIFGSSLSYINPKQTNYITKNIALTGVSTINEVSTKDEDATVASPTTISSEVTNTIANVTTSQIKDTSPTKEWVDNITVKSIVAGAIKNTNNSIAPQATDIEIIRVNELESLGSGNYKKLAVSFNLINELGINSAGNVVQSLPLSTTIIGFDNSVFTTIPSSLIAQKSGVAINSLYPYELTDFDLKSIIANGFSNTNGSVSLNDIDVTSRTDNIKTGSIDVTFNLINNKYLSSNGSSEASKTFSINIFGLKLISSETNFGWNNNETIDASSGTFFSTPLLLPALDLKNEAYNKTLISIVRSKITGAVPNSFKIAINVTNTTDNSIIFDAVLTNYFDDTGLVTTPYTISNISITNLPVSRPHSNNSYINWPILNVNTNVANYADSLSVTINDYLPNTSIKDQYETLKQTIFSSMKNLNPLATYKDIEIINQPIYSASNNLIEVNFSIINNMFMKDGTYIQSSDSITAKIVGFKYTDVINANSYTITPVAGIDFSKVYASDLATEFGKIISGNSEPDVALNNLLISLSKYVQVNVSNLQPEYTTFRFTANDNDTTTNTGSLLIELTSARYFDDSNNYQNSDKVISQYKLSGFARTYATDRTRVNFMDEAPDVFASSINLTNVDKYVSITNLPTGVTPVYTFEPVDLVLDSSGNPTNYGKTTITVTLSNFYNSNLELAGYSAVYTGEIRTKPFLSTYLSEQIVNREYNNFDLNNLDEKIIKTIISENLVNKPSSFNPIDDIAIVNTDYNYDEGLITLSFNLTGDYYYRGDVVTTQEKTFSDITISGFKSSSKRSSTPFYKETWFYLITSASGIGLLLLIVVFLFTRIGLNRKNKDF